MTRTVAEIIDRIHLQKYRREDQTYDEAWERMASSLSTNDIERRHFETVLFEQYALPAGRIITKYSTDRDVTGLNCFVSETIGDSMDGIMRAVARSAETLRRSGGIGHDFSTIRPRGFNINSFDTPASGPVSFITIWEAMGKTISSAGNRRGAMMGVLRCDHPDIEEFIACKAVNPNPFTMFNFSVGITDRFMRAVQAGGMFDLRWEGKTVKTLDARGLWKKIMTYAYEWADPGVLFLDTINDMNNLWYCEDIAATNPCGEQPLPPNGACLLGSINLAKMVDQEKGNIHWERLKYTTRLMIRMLNRVIDTTSYPFPEQEREMKDKRRIGLGIMGLANCIEALGIPYGTPAFLVLQESIQQQILYTAYDESVELAIKEGSFPLYDKECYLAGRFIKTLPKYYRDRISTHGIRNSHLTSIAPTGSISLLCGNISSGIEPVFSEYTQRKILFSGSTEPELHTLEDYGVREFGTKPRIASDVSMDEHLGVLTVAQRYTDSAVSKTINCGNSISREEFDRVYLSAWEGGAKGCTVYRSGCKREGILAEAKVEDINAASSCYIDENGRAQCG